MNRLLSLLAGTCLAGQALAAVEEKAVIAHYADLAPGRDPGAFLFMGGDGDPRNGSFGDRCLYDLEQGSGHALDLPPPDDARWYNHFSPV
jgi:hypothetical protein